MPHDCLIIGGGIAGLTCGLRCAAAGLSTAVFTAGMSALHFSSGSIDLLGHHPGRQVVAAPYAALPDFLAGRPDHPYARCGPDLIKESLTFFRQQLCREGLDFYSNGAENHFHVTALGTIKPTYLSPRTVFDEEIKSAFLDGSPIAILNFEGFRDFHPALAAVNLRRHSLFRNRSIITGTVALPRAWSPNRSSGEFRSIDLARLFESPRAIQEIAGRIGRAAGSARLVGLPAVLGLSRHAQVLAALRAATGLLLYETPTLPPSLLGMRLDQALKSRFAALGGILVTGDQVIGGRIQGGLLREVQTRLSGPDPIQARWHVLATGSFFSGGLSSLFHAMSEPIFGLEIAAAPDRQDWSGERFLNPGGHPFLGFGVRTDEELRPWGPGSEPVKNLYCAGAVLTGYDPIREGTGAGVAIATGYRAAAAILTEAGRS